MTAFGFIVFDLWQVKAETIFDNVIITDDAAEPDAFAAAQFMIKTNGWKLHFGQRANIQKSRIEFKSFRVGSNRFVLGSDLFEVS